MLETDIILQTGHFGIEPSLGVKNQMNFHLMEASFRNYVYYK